MKKIELKNLIKENLIDILEEENGVISTNDPRKAEEFVKKGINVNLTETEEEPTKEDLEKIDVPNNSKFKISNEEFKKFQLILNTLVKKIHSLEDGEEKSKKLQALKQYIKNPDLITAFEERQVDINTDGLVG